MSKQPQNLTYSKNGNTTTVVQDPNIAKMVESLRIKDAWTKQNNNKPK